MRVTPTNINVRRRHVLRGVSCWPINPFPGDKVTAIANILPLWNAAAVFSQNVDDRLWVDMQSNKIGYLDNAKLDNVEWNGDHEPWITASIPGLYLRELFDNSCRTISIGVCLPSRFGQVIRVDVGLIYNNVKAIIGLALKSLRAISSPQIKEAVVKEVPAPPLVCVETNPGPFEQNALENADVFLSPLKFLGFYENETQSSVILSQFDKSEIEKQFVRKMMDDEDISNLFVLNYGQLFRECPSYLDFTFLEEDANFFLRRVHRPRVVALSAIVHMEILIHEAKQTKAEEDLLKVKDFTKILQDIQNASEYQDGLTLPPKYCQAYGQAYTVAKNMPYPEEKKVVVPEVLPDPILETPCASKEVPLIIEQSKKLIPILDWSSIPSVSCEDLEDSDKEDELDSDDEDELDSDDENEILSEGKEIELSRETNNKREEQEHEHNEADEMELEEMKLQDKRLMDMMENNFENCKYGNSEQCEETDMEDVCGSYENNFGNDGNESDEEDVLNSDDEIFTEEKEIGLSSEIDQDNKKDKQEHEQNKADEVEFERREEIELERKTDKDDVEKQEHSHNNDETNGNKCLMHFSLEQKDLEKADTDDDMMANNFENCNYDVGEHCEEMETEDVYGSDENNFINGGNEMNEEPKKFEEGYLNKSDKMFSTTSEQGHLDWASLPAYENSSDSDDSICSEPESSHAMPQTTLLNKQHIKEVVDLTGGQDSDCSDIRETFDFKVDELPDLERKSFDCDANDEKLLNLCEPTHAAGQFEKNKVTANEGSAKTSITDKTKYMYSTILHLPAPSLIQMIRKQNLPPIWTDSRYLLLNHLVVHGLVIISDDDIKKLKKLCESSQKYFNILERCFSMWPNEELVNTIKEDHNYGTKKLILNDSKSADSLIKCRPFKAKRKIRAKCTTGDVKVYECQGNYACQREECLFKKSFQDDELVKEKMNSTQFVEKKVNGKKVKFCLYCKTDGVEETTIEFLKCPSKLYWNHSETENIVYTLGEHNCCPIYNLAIPSKFVGDLRNRGYKDTVKNFLSQELENPEMTIGAAYELASKISVGSSKGTQVKHMIIGKPSPVVKRVEHLITRLLKLDPNFVLANEKECIIISSSKSLKKALHFDTTHGIYTEPGFLDVCFSRVQGSSWVACCLYFYEPIGCCIIKVCTGYVPSESTEHVSKILIIFNKKVGEIAKIKDFRLKPKQLFIDFSDVNRASFLAAGYTEEELNSMLEGCGKHFRDMAEQVKREFPNNEDKALFETYLYNYKECIIFSKMETIFDTLRNFVSTKIKDKKTKQEILKRLLWWKEREACWSKAYSALKHVDSNLSESGHSPSLKYGSMDEAILDDAVTHLYQNGKLIAIGNGSTIATGSGPNYEQIQELKSLDLNGRLDQIEEEFHQPTEAIDLNEIGENSDIETENDTPIIVENVSECPEIAVGRKLMKRRIQSGIFKTNFTRSRQLNVTVVKVGVDTELKKSIVAKINKKYGLFSKQETCTITFSKTPNCNCSDCQRNNARSRTEVCAPQIWMRKKLLGMFDTSYDLYQVVFTEEEVKSILSNWVPPTINSNVDLENLFREQEVKHPPSEIKYFLEKTTIHTARRRCFSGVHSIYGKDIHTPPGNLNICVEGALKVPKDKPLAYPGPVYLCAKNSCCYVNLPKRCNISRDRCPPLISIRDPFNSITAPEITKLENEEGFSFH